MKLSDETREKMISCLAEWAQYPTHDPWDEKDDYKRVCVAGEFRDMLLDDTDRTLMEYLEDLQDEEMPKNLFNDGSKGQWRMCKNYKIQAVKMVKDWEVK